MPRLLAQPRKSQAENSISKRSSFQGAEHAQGGAVDITVEDDGPGILEGDRENAFVAGERFDDAVLGTGLGLSIARDIARLYGGEISLSDSPMGGLSAQLHLPQRMNPDPTKAG